MTDALVPIARGELVRVLPWEGQPDPATRYIARLAPGSQPAQRSALVTIARMLGHDDPRACPWHAMTLSEADALTARLFAEYKVRTANRMIAAVRGVLDVCRLERWFVLHTEDGYRESYAEHFEALCERLTSRKARGNSVRREIPASDLNRVLEACQSDGVRGLRDAAIVALGVGAGLRREEIADLLVEHLHEDGRIDVVDGKGGKDRTTFLPDEAHELVRAWLAVRGDSPGAVITRLANTPNGPVVVPGLPSITPHAVWEAIRARFDAIGVPYTPHDMRSTFATRLLRDKVPLKAVQELLGHEDIRTTTGYDRSRLEEIRDQVKRVGMKR